MRNLIINDKGDIKRNRESKSPLNEFLEAEDDDEGEA
jgi:hypothetical protein